MTRDCNTRLVAMLPMTFPLRLKRPIRDSIEGTILQHLEVLKVITDALFSLKPPGPLKLPLKGHIYEKEAPLYIMEPVTVNIKSCMITARGRFTLQNGSGRQELRC